MATDDTRSTRASLLEAVKDPSNQAAWRAFFQQYQPLLVSGCCRLGLQAADAEEVAQRILGRLVEVLPGFRYDAARSFGSWLKTLVHNEVCTFWRERQRRPGDHGTGDSQVQALLAEQPDDSLAVEVSARINDDLEFAQAILQRVREQVEPHVWQAFWLSTYEGLTGAEVSRRLGIKVAFVYVFKGRVQKRLQEAAAKTDPGLS